MPRLLLAARLFHVPIDPPRFREDGGDRSCSLAAVSVDRFAVQVDNVGQSDTFPPRFATSPHGYSRTLTQASRGSLSPHFS